MFDDSTRPHAFSWCALVALCAIATPTLVLAACSSDSDETAKQPVQTTPNKTSETVDSGTSNLPHLLAGPGETCWFEAMGTRTWCEDYGYPNFIDPHPESVQDCADACLEEATCTAIIDWFWLDDSNADQGCVLHTAGCDETQRGREEEDAYFYRKVCGKNPPGDAIVNFDEYSVSLAETGADAG